MTPTDLAAGWQLKAKAALRLFPIFINKGVTALYWFNTGNSGSGSDDRWLGACYDRFLKYAGTNSAYPANDEPFTSPWLKVVGRVSARIGLNLDPAFATNALPEDAAARPLAVESISDAHDHFQFAGDGTAAHPNLYNRELLAILPFQANPNWLLERDDRCLWWKAPRPVGRWSIRCAISHHPIPKLRATGGSRPRQTAARIPGAFQVDWAR